MPDDLNNMVKGKKKTGGIQFNKMQKMVKITFSSGKEVIMKSPFKGAIIEINEQVVKNSFGVVNKMPESEGYLFIANNPAFELNLDSAEFTMI